jgi:hypothetical protein
MTVDRYASIFQVSPLVRVVATADGWKQSIGDYASSYGVHLNSIQTARGMVHYSSTGEHTSAIETVIGECLYNGDFADASVKIGNYFDNANKYAYRSPEDKPYNYVFKTFKGYGQGEWNEVVAYSNQNDQEALERLVEEFDTYYKGEVYEVSVEYAKVFTATDGEELLKWEVDNDYDYTEVVQEFFTLTADFILDTYGLEVVIEVEG